MTRTCLEIILWHRVAAPFPPFASGAVKVPVCIVDCAAHEVSSSVAAAALLGLCGSSDPLIDLKLFRGRSHPAQRRFDKKAPPNVLLNA